MKTFSINSCRYKGCSNWLEGSCWLDGQQISRWITHFEFFSDGSTCQIRAQINKTKTKELLEDKL